jgi:hypothetical protein
MERPSQSRHGRGNAPLSSHFRALSDLLRGASIVVIHVPTALHELSTRHGGLRIKLAAPNCASADRYHRRSLLRADLNLIQRKHGRPPLLALIVFKA